MSFSVTAFSYNSGVLHDFFVKAEISSQNFYKILGTTINTVDLESAISSLSFNVFPPKNAIFVPENQQVAFTNRSKI